MVHLKISYNSSHRAKPAIDDYNEQFDSLGADENLLADHAIKSVNTN
jgi:hypothetical protein